jgi:prepilin-type N-terminal cleavage/methylation domain-containing protein
MSNKGFTLIELLVYTAVLSLVLTLSAQFSLGVLEASAKSIAKERVQANAANILQAFDFEVRHAQALYTPTSNFTSDPGQLSLVTSRNLPGDETRSYTDIYADNGRLCMKRELTGLSCVSSSEVEITSLVFTRVIQVGGVESARMRFVIRNRSPKAEYRFDQTVQTSARLRSY